MVKLVTVVGAVTGTFHTGREMIVLKKGVEVEVSEAGKAWLEEHGHIGEGSDADFDAADADTNASEDLALARVEYREVFGKNPGPKWSAEEIYAKIDEARGDDGADTANEGQAPA